MLVADELQVCESYDVKCNGGGTRPKRVCYDVYDVSAANGGEEQIP